MKTTSFWIVFLLLACNSKQPAEEKTTNVSTSIAPYFLPCPDNVVNSLGSFSVEEDKLYVFDNFNYGVEEINLVTLDTVFHGFEPDDPDAPIEVERLKVIGADSLLLLYDNKLYLTDFKGEEFQQFDLIHNLQEIYRSTFHEYPYDKLGNDLVYDQHSKMVFFYFVNPAESSNKNIFAGYSLKEKRWVSTPIKHPKHYSETPLDYTTFPSAVISEDGVLSFIYVISPIISSYDFISEKQFDREVKSFEGKQFAEPQTLRNEWSNDYFSNWLLTNPAYVKLLYDPYRKLYYRLSVQAMDGGDPNDAFEQYVTNSQPYLAILDKSMKVLKNMPLEKGKYELASSFVFTKGIWLGYQMGKVPDEAHIYGDLVTVDLD